MNLTNKTVALVCPAQYIEDLDQRAWINSFDVVVRVNGSIPIPKKIQQTTTERCELLYVARNITPVYEWIQPTEIRIKPDALWEPYKKDAKKDPYVFKREKMLPYKNKIHLAHPSSYYGFLSDTGTIPNMGMIAILDILREEPSRLYVTGMSFYEDELFYAGYANQFKNKLKETKGNIFGHDQAVQKEYFKNLKKKYEWILCHDDYMLKYLKV